MNNLVWFRNDLRTKDHDPLLNAVKGGNTVAVYCFDPRKFGDIAYGFPKTGTIRTQFLIESVKELSQQLRTLGCDLLIRTGRPEEIIPKLVKELEVDQLFYHGEVTAEEQLVENSMREKLSIPIKRYWGHAMYHRDGLPFDLLTVPDVFTQFRKQVEKKSTVRKPLLAPQSIESNFDVEIGEIPEISDLGLELHQPDSRSVLDFKGGEKAAWDRLQHYFYEVDELRNYKFTRNGLLGADYSSKFSPWLAHGCISARSIFSEVDKYEQNVHKNVSTYWLKFELIWRDYFRYSAIKHGNLIFQLGGIQQKKLEKNTDRSAFEKWANGKTGVPFVDANMRELNRTGYMSNRGRQNVASFLAQNMNFDWRWGAAWFESKLLDYDVCSNWGNWAYNSTVGHDPRNRYFNILNQARKYDKKGEYIRKWLPELRNLPREFVHEPHKMTPDQQTLYEVNIGSDYPAPMLDLDKTYEEIKDRG